MKRASLLVQLTLFNKRSVSAAHYHIFQPMFSPLRSLFTSLGLNNLSPPRSRFHLALARSLAPSIKAVYRWFILSNRFVPIIIIIIITEPLNILSATPSEDEENPALCRQYIDKEVDFLQVHLGNFSAILEWLDEEMRQKINLKECSRCQGIASTLLSILILISQNTYTT